MRQQDENIKREEEVVIQQQELALKQPVLKGWLLPVLNHCRIWALPKSKQKIIKTEPNSLNEWEKNKVDAFEKLRQDHRKLSYHYANQYKGSYYLNYKLAVLAVSLAVVSLGLLYFESAYSEYFSGGAIQAVYFLVLFFGVCKLLALLVIYFNSKQAKDHEFNERAITYRLLMEQFRYMLYLPLLGMNRLPALSSDRYISLKWQESHAQKYFREQVNKVMKHLHTLAGTRQTEVDYNNRLAPILDFIQKDWIKKQEAYHTDKMEIERNIDKQYERRVKNLNITVISIVLFDVIAGCGILWWLPEQWRHFLHHAGTPLILIFATIIPALVASYNALRFQNEAKKLSDRSAFMEDLIEEKDHEYGALINRIKESSGKANNRGSFTGEAIALVNDTVQDMLDEVTEWTYIYTKDIMDM